MTARDVLDGIKARRQAKAICAVDDCAALVNGQGLCSVHYGRAKRAGKLAKRQTTEERFWSRVEKTSGCWNWTGSANSSGYGSLGVTIKKKRIYMKAHRMSFEMAKGSIPVGILIDHVCHNRLCVNPDHLRLATPKQNCENLTGQRVDNTTGYRGVHRYRGGKFVAAVGHEGTKIHVGYFDTAEKANEAAMAKRNELFTHNDIDRRAFKESP